MSGPGARAILIATGTHVAGSTLPDVRLAAATAQEMAKSLVNYCGFQETHVSTVVDAEDPKTLLTSVQEVASQADDVLLLYYVGHGVLNASGALHLATRATVDLSRGMAAYQALPFNEITDALAANCRARSILMILDCCYAYRALAPVQPGYALLASADRDVQALVPQGERHPLFSGRLINVLGNGDPAGPPQLSVRDVYRYVSRAVVSSGGPGPRMHTGDRAADLILCRNRAYRPPADASPTEETGSAGTDVCPYRGLDSYAVEDEEVFHGRDLLTAQVVQRLTERVWDGGPSIIIGPSGSGKSSLLHAGILPAILRGNLPIPGSSGWPYVTLTPGRNPVAALANRLASLTDADSAQIAASMEADPLSVVGIIATALNIRPESYSSMSNTRRRLLIVIDQFEELFAPEVGEISRRAFIDVLRAATGAADHADDELGESGSLVLVGLRSDFYARCAQYPWLQAALQERQTVVGAMSATELREAIIEPARKSGLEVQPGLVELLLRDIGTAQPGGYDAGALPYLSFALLSTWQNRRNRLLTADDYTATGGVTMAIAQAAERTYLSLPPRGQRAAEELLLGMVNVAEDLPDTRRRASYTALLESQPDKSAAVDALEALAAARLITIGNGTVQLAHEALIRSWPRFNELISADRQGLHTRQQLSVDAKRWDTTGRDPSGLYRGMQLAIAQASTHRMNLAPITRAFLQSSTQRQRRATYARRITTAALTVLTIVATIMSVAFRQQVTIAGQQRDQALSRQLAAEVSSLNTTQPGLARQLAVTAYQTAPTDQASAALLTSMSTPGMLPQPASVEALASDPRRSIIAVATAEGIKLDDSVTGNVLGTIPDKSSALAFSSDGRTIASGAPSGAITLWNVARPRNPVLVTRFPAYGGGISTVTFSPHGHLLGATYMDNSTAIIWHTNLPPQKAIDVKFTGVMSLAFGPKAMLATGNSLSPGHRAKVQLWHLTPFGLPVSLRTITIRVPASEGGITALAFSPRANTIAIGMLWDPGLQSGASGTHGAGATIANISNLLHPRFTSLTDVTTTPKQVAYSPDGNTLAIYARPFAGYGNVYIWNVSASHPVAEESIPGSAETHAGFAFSPDSVTLSTGGGNHVLLWRITDPFNRAALATIQSDTDESNAFSSTPLAFSPKRNLLATETVDGLTQVWDVASSAHPVLLSTIPAESAGGSPTWILAFSPDGRYLAIGGSSVRIWNLADLGRPSIVWARATSGFISDINFSPDGRYVAAAVDAGTRPGAYIWSVSNPTQRIVLPVKEAGTENVWNQTVLFPSGSRILWILSGRTMSTWDITDMTDAPIRPLAKFTISGNSDIGDVAFSPVSHILAIGLVNDDIQLRQVATPQSKPISIGLLSGATSGQMSFSPDGRTLSVDTDAGPSLWNVADPSKATFIATLPSPGEASFAVFSPDGRSLVDSNGADARVNLWDIDYTDLMHQLCRNSGTPITRAQWQYYLGNQPYKPPCQRP